MRLQTYICPMPAVAYPLVGTATASFLALACMTASTAPWGRAAWECPASPCRSLIGSWTWYQSHSLYFRSDMLRSFAPVRVLLHCAKRSQPRTISRGTASSMARLCRRMPWRTPPVCLLLWRVMANGGSSSARMSVLPLMFDTAALGRTRGTSGTLEPISIRSAYVMSRPEKRVRRPAYCAKTS
jgi:hypothetical protein